MKGNGVQQNLVFEQIKFDFSQPFGGDVKGPDEILQAFAKCRVAQVAHGLGNM